MQAIFMSEVNAASCRSSLVVPCGRRSGGPCEQQPRMLLAARGGDQASQSRRRLPWIVALAGIRAIGERANAQLKCWKVLAGDYRGSPTRSP